jgi:spore coat protein H
VAADLTVDGDFAGQVGLRFKGSSGTLVRCARPGALICPKVSMKIKFNEFDPERRWQDLKRLNFNSMRSDQSYLHERLGYHLFREMGVPAPRAVHARLVVNGEDRGIYSLVEDIDGRFTDARFDKGDGNLYKEQWPTTSNARTLTQRLETNEEEANHDAMLEFQAALFTAQPDELPDVVTRYMDIDQLLAYLVVDRTIANWDGITAFYCFGNGCRNHNYFFYRHEDVARFSLIPWDLDNTFRVANPFEYVPSALSIPEDCGARYPAIGTMKALAPSCDPLLQGVARTDRSRHEAQQTRMLEGPFEAKTLDAWLDARVAQLRPLVAAESRGPGETAFLTEVEALRRDLRLFRERLRAERDGEDSTLSRLDVAAVNDFEAATPLGIRFGNPARAGRGSSFEVRLREGDALTGERHLELGFELQDSGEPWTQWARFTLPFDSPDAADLTGKSLLRLVLRADAPRTIRISLDSSNYSAVERDETFGWDVTADGTRQVLELPLASASLPAGTTLPDQLGDILLYATGLFIEPVAKERSASGFLGSGQRDAGRIQIDDLQFLP